MCSSLSAEIRTRCMVKFAAWIRYIVFICVVILWSIARHRPCDRLVERRLTPSYAAAVPRGCGTCCRTAALRCYRIIRRCLHARTCIMYVVFVCSRVRIRANERRGVANGDVTCCGGKGVKSAGDCIRPLRTIWIWKPYPDTDSGYGLWIRITSKF